MKQILQITQTFQKSLSTPEDWSRMELYPNYHNRKTNSLQWKVYGKQSTTKATPTNLDYNGSPGQLCRTIMLQHLSSSKRCEHDLEVTPTNWKCFRTLFLLTSTKDTLENYIRKKTTFNMMGYRRTRCHQPQQAQKR